MAHLMGRNKADKVSHEFVGKAEAAGAGIHGGSLHLIPVMHQRHHIVIPADVAFQDFTAAGIVHVGAVGIGNGGSQIADDGETRIFQAHAQFLGILRPFLGADGVLPSGLLEGDLPVIDTGNEVRTPLPGRSGIDIIDNGLDGLYELSPFLLFYVLGTGFQAPAGNVADRLHPLLVIGEMRIAAGEVTDAGVEPALLHGNFRKQQERRIEHHRNHAGLTARRKAAGTGRTALIALRLVVSERLGHRHLRIDGVGAHAPNEAGIGLDAAQIVLFLGGGVQGKHLKVSLEQAVGLDAGGTGRCFLLRLEGRHNGVLGAHAHRLGNGIGLGGLYAHDVYPEEEVAVRGLLPVQHGIVHLFTAVLAGTHGIGGKTRHGQDAAPEKGVGNFQVPVFLVMGDREKTLTELQLYRSGSLFLFFLFLLGRSRNAEGQGKKE